MYKINNAGDNTKIICSESVNFVSEYRCPTAIDKSIVQEMVKDFLNSPKAYCIDAGVLSSGETALIEVNDAFSIGKYSMSKELYAELLITRWNELKGYKCDNKPNI